MPPTAKEIENVPAILANSPLTLPWRNGDSRGLTAAEAAYTMSNKVQAAIVNAAGGPEGFVEKTLGGRLNPNYWPFTLPTYEEIYPPAPVSPQPDVLANLPGIPSPGEPAYVARLEGLLREILGRLPAVSK